MDGRTETSETFEYKKRNDIDVGMSELQTMDDFVQPSPDSVWTTPNLSWMMLSLAAAKCPTT